MWCSGLYAIGQDDEGVEHDDAADRARLDAGRPTRRAASTRQTDGQTTAHRRASGLHWNVAFRHCEDMAAVGVVDNLSEPRRAGPPLDLGGEEGDLIRTVMKEANGG